MHNLTATVASGPMSFRKIYDEPLVYDLINQSLSLLNLLLSMAFYEAQDGIGNTFCLGPAPHSRLDALQAPLDLGLPVWVLQIAQDLR